jgi:hypothetical protein
MSKTTKAPKGYEPLNQDHNSSHKPTKEDLDLKKSFKSHTSKNAYGIPKEELKAARSPEQIQTVLEKLREREKEFIQANTPDNSPTSVTAKEGSKFFGR